jgi:putative NADPH-quinone reductase
MAPGVAFRLDDGRVRPALVQVRRIVTVSTYGSPWTYVKAINDNGRRTLQRALRLSTGWRTTRRHLGLYKMDVRTDVDRARFVSRVEKVLSR